MITERWIVDLITTLFKMFYMTKVIATDDIKEIKTRAS